MCKKGHFTQQLHKGGVHLKRVGGTGVNVEGGCMYSLEVPSVKRHLGSKDEANWAPTCSEGCNRMLCNRLPNYESKIKI